VVSFNAKIAEAFERTAYVRPSQKKAGQAVQMRVAMNKFLEAAIILGLFCFVCVLANADAKAQTLSFPTYNIALKSGESVELGDVYHISADCKSLLKATPQVEILDGPDHQVFPSSYEMMGLPVVLMLYLGALSPPTKSPAALKAPTTAL
jgi:hypothetical protein